jgi:formate-dependent nitrite reductase cytochrome c552 subunit
MQVVFDGFRKLKEEINVSVIAGMTGFSKDVVRLALENERKQAADFNKRMQRKLQEHAREVTATSHGSSKER